MPIGSLPMISLIKFHNRYPRWIAWRTPYRSTTTSNGFVIPKTFRLLFSRLIASKSKSEIVAVALRCSTGFEGSEDYVRNSLTLRLLSAKYLNEQERSQGQLYRQNIATDNCSLFGRREK